MKIDFKLAGARELTRALEHYQRAMRKDAFNALRKAAFETSRSLIARTDISKKGPKVKVASKGNLEMLAPMMPKPKRWRTTETQFRHYVKTLGRRVYVAQSDRQKDKGYRAKAVWMRERFTKQEVTARMSYKRRGLAKASWRWCSKKSKTGAAVADGNAKVKRSIRDNCAVHADMQKLRIVISNHLPYIRAALSSPSAIDQALRAAANSMRAQAEKALAKRAQKAGLAA